MKMFEVLFDTETSDPDDMCALLFLCSHRDVDLKAVTVTPGTLDQIGLVKSFLKMAGKENVPVGSRKPDHPKDCVSGFFRKHYKFEPAQPDALGWEVMSNFFKTQEYGILLTGAPLGNCRAFLENTEGIDIPRWVGQGGFAGDSVVPEKHRLAKFAGMEICPTFNFNGDPKGAFAMLSDPRVLRRELVSKNVCHGVVYDKAVHEDMKTVEFWTSIYNGKDKLGWMCGELKEEDKVNEVRTRVIKPAFDALVDLMDKYLADHPQGKMFHDPLAAACVISGAVCDFEEVEVYREKGMWGSRKQEGTGTRISVNVDKEAFYNVLVGGLG